MIQGRNRLAHRPEHALALDCIEEVIHAVAPETVTQSAISLNDETLSILGTDYDLTKYNDVLVVGGGKAAGGVACTLESTLGNRITDGLVVTKSPVETTIIETVVGDHPIPSTTNVEATSTLLDHVKESDRRTLVLFVLTGGASALLTSPAGNLTLTDLQKTTESLLKNGVPINGINAVRKHCSDVKGGNFARRAAPADVVGLVLSDVVGNDLSTIGSGPSVPDETTFDDAQAVLNQYDIDTPELVAAHIKSGIEGDFDETPNPDDPVFDSTQNFLIGDNKIALDAVCSVAVDAGYETCLLSSRLRGEAKEVAKTFVAIGEEVATTGNPVEPPAVIIGGGESTVTITDDGGSGGPNQELVLSGALECSDPVVLAAVDTDGEDGSSAVAGAIADENTITDRASARDHLQRNDAGTYLREVGATIETGPTGTNVNDVIVLVVPDNPD